MKTKRETIYCAYFGMGSEDSEQEALFEWARTLERAYPELRLMHHIPNGGKRDAAVAAALKRRGVKAGVPDIFLPCARGRYHGLYVELKVGRNKTSEKQNEFIAGLKAEDFAVMIAYGWREAAEIIEAYLKIGTCGGGDNIGKTCKGESARGTL